MLDSQSRTEQRHRDEMVKEERELEEENRILKEAKKVQKQLRQ